MILSASDLLLV